uniref:Nucleotidyl transferase AbiEii/AbiGii toxin family protein n=1 Tax=Thermofilum pendens TaxID=2269 RepID=A0A7J3X6E2_THEPE
MVALLREEELARLARLRRLKPWQEEKRYVQALIMYAVSEWPLVMKGGTYLWFFHGLSRFSEDLDYTAVGRVDADRVEEVAEVLRLFGVASAVKVLKDDEYTLTVRVAARGPLFKSEKDTCYVRLDISRREKPLLKPTPVRLDEPHYGIPLVYIRGMDLQEVLAEKLRAVYVRSDPRDAYDAWHLCARLGVPLDPGLLERKLSFYGAGLDPEKLLAAIRAAGRSWGRLKPLVFGALPDYSEVEQALARCIARQAG